jgi:hypothetical protein
MIDFFSKDSINLGIFIFILVISVLLFCFSFYYIIPNNYDLYEKKLINNIQPLKTFKIKINPNNKYKINNENIDDCINNMIIEIKTDKKNYPIKILLNNFLKSQNILVNEDTLFKSVNNNYIIILNNSDEPINLDVNLYSIEKIIENIK